MQTDPALPWSAGTGGRILLRQPVTRQDLLDGHIQLVVSKNAHLSILSAVDYQGNLKLTDVEASDFYYDIAAFTGETLELVLTAIGNSTSVVSVLQFDEAPTGIISYPTGQWGTQVTEAVIKLPNYVDEGQMQAGVVRFAGQGASYAPILRGSDTFQVKINGVDAFEFIWGSSSMKEIQLSRNGSGVVDSVVLQTSDVYTNAPLPTSDSPLYIGLKDSIARDALLAGALLFSIKDDPTDTAGDAEVYDASGDLIIGKTQNAYAIADIYGSTKSLTVTKMLTDPSIEHIQRLPIISPLPDLPWSGISGHLEINSLIEISRSDVTQGKLKVYCGDTEATINSGSQFRCQVNGETVLSFNIEGATRQIVCVREEADAPAVTKIEYNL